MSNKELAIKNEILIYEAEEKQIADLLSTSTDNVSLHLKNIYKASELDEKATTEDYLVVRQESNWSFKYQTQWLSL